MHWLLEGDPSIRWQVRRDLLNQPLVKVEAERRKIEKEGWGKRLLDLQDSDGRWGGGMYGPKFISTTYTMLTLRLFGLPPNNPQAKRACKLFLDEGFYADGGINFFSRTAWKHSETCVTGMILSMLAYFRYSDGRLHAIADHLVNQQMKDGGWNCESYKGATHSSFHTTIAIKLLQSKQRKDGCWVINTGMSGRKFFDLEKAGQPSRWNTLRAMRVLNWWRNRQDGR